MGQKWTECSCELLQVSQLHWPSHLSTLTYFFVSSMRVMHFSSSFQLVILLGFGRLKWGCIVHIDVGYIRICVFAFEVQNVTGHINSIMAYHSFRKLILVPLKYEHYTLQNYNNEGWLATLNKIEKDNNWYESSFKEICLLMQITVMLILFEDAWQVWTFALLAIFCT